jgi:hypothetical protein
MESRDERRLRALQASLSRRHLAQFVPAIDRFQVLKQDDFTSNRHRLVDWASFDLGSGRNALAEVLG